MTPDGPPAHETAAERSGARRASYAVAKALTALFLVGVVVEFFLAGLGTFGVTGRIDDDRATTSFDPHRGVGTVLVAVALLILIATAIARPGGRMLKLAGVLLVLMIVQNVLARTGTTTHVLGALHALNGLLILGTAGLLAVTSGALRRRS